LLSESFRYHMTAVLEYQLDRLTSGGFLHGRFYSDTGDDLLASWQLAFQKPLLGWGFFSPAGVVVNDSLYLVLFYCGGTLGCLIFAALLCILIIPPVKDILKKRMLVVWLAVMLLAGFGSFAFFNPRIGDWWWAIVGIVEGARRRYRVSLPLSAQDRVGTAVASPSS
jgi:hypothetical protein